MARMVPPVVSAETPASERRVFEALKTASESTEWTVLHSLGFSSAWTGEFGEIDFVVIIPRVESSVLKSRVARWQMTTAFGLLAGTMLRLLKFSNAVRSAKPRRGCGS